MVTKGGMEGQERGKMVRTFARQRNLRMGLVLERGVGGVFARRRSAIRTQSRTRVRRTEDAPDRLDFIEGMRGLAALYVVLSHFVSMADWRFSQGKSSTSPEWLRALMAPFTHGHLAVAAFIVISGFCLQYALFRPSSAGAEGRMRGTGRFFRRRALRILPAYYGSLVLSVLVTATVTTRMAGSQPFDTYLPLDSSTLLSHIFLVHNLSINWMYKLNGALWSIAIEAQLYLLFPMLVRTIWRRGRRATLFGSAALTVRPGATKLYFWFLPLFVVGMVAAHLAFRPHPRRGILPRVATLLASVLGLATWGAVLGNLPIAASDLLFGGLIACVCYAMTVQPGRWGERLLSIRPLFALGGFSYSLYLIHSPLQQVLWVLRP
ncbi:MAG: hypothetical protein C4320_01405, partial [Armatimonadota bacterium]